jgi:hypothetical protein
MMFELMMVFAVTEDFNLELQGLASHQRILRFVKEP